MGVKKDLRRALAAAEHEAAGLATQRRALEADRQELADRMLEAGLLRVGGIRTQADRIRAARAGVLVLADVLISRDTEFRMERDVIRSAFQGDVPGPIRAYATLEITGDPAVLEALQQHLRAR